MPKDYSKGKIYKIVCNITNKIYIGSTCEPTLARRLAKHVSNFKDWKNKKGSYITSFQILEGEDYYIELLEICPCTINEELLARERFYIKSIECVNKIKNLNLTEEDKKERNKIYKENNKDKLKESKKISDNIYREKNIDKLKEQKKDYYNKNKDKILEHAKNDKILVICSQCNKSREITKTSKRTSKSDLCKSCSCKINLIKANEKKALTATNPL
jgi:hypothetical protein